MSGRATPAVLESSPAYGRGSAKKRGGSTPWRAIVSPKFLNVMYVVRGTYVKLTGGLSYFCAGLT